MTRTRIRERFRNLVADLREDAPRQMARNFLKSILLLGVALLAALYSNSSARDGRILPSAIGAMISLSIALWVGIRFVPRLAAGVDWDWLPFFTQYRVSRDGWIFIAATTVVTSAAINTSNNLLYMVLSAMLAVLLLSGLLSGLNFRFVEAGARMPDTCFARQPFPLTLMLGNGKRVFPTFSLQVEPAEGSPFEFTSFYTPLIRTRETVSRTGDAVLSSRGRHALSEIHVRSRYPFGFLVKGRPLPVGAETIAFPEIIPMEELNFQIQDLLGVTERFERGFGMDLYMIREYQASDSARHVDWKATAKTAALKTREFAAEESRRVVLAFDRWGPPGREDAFELHVSRAASLALHLVRSGVELSLVSDEWSSPAGRSDNLLESILRYLALVEMSPMAPAPLVRDEQRTVHLSLRALAETSPGVGVGV